MRANDALDSTFIATLNKAKGQVSGTLANCIEGVVDKARSANPGR